MGKINKIFNDKARVFLLRGLLAFLALPLVVSVAGAEEIAVDAYIYEGLKYEKHGDYYQAARYYFQSLQNSPTDEGAALAYAYISNALIAQGLHQSASYFYLKAMGSGSERAIRLAAKGTGELVDNVGGVIFKKFVLKYAREEFFSPEQKDYYLYFLAQDQLNNGKPGDVVRAVHGINANFTHYPSALFLRGTALLLTGNIKNGIEDFEQCAKILTRKEEVYRKTLGDKELIELQNRCIAGVARGYYQDRNYQEAEVWYDRIDMRSFVWPQVQYERAWTSIARGDYNRALGRLISYKAPGLNWFHDAEVEMLRAISYLQLCIYSDVDKESIGFMQKYGSIGQEIKKILEESSSGSAKALVQLFQMGMEAAKNKVQTPSQINQVLNRFVRSPYFLQLMQTGDKVRRETAYIERIAGTNNRGLSGFLREVLLWRWQTAQEIGGMFVRDRLNTEYKNLLGNISMIDIIKLEVLRRARQTVEQSSSDSFNAGEDIWGNKKRGSLGRPNVKNDQYYWDFNGEFWADELGDYVLALRPECR